MTTDKLNYADLWDKRSHEMRAIKIQEIRSIDTAESIDLFTGMVEWANEKHGSRQTSGLIEQQAVFSRNASPKPCKSDVKNLYTTF